ncbi:MAG: hypothetical protein H6753_03570 [Candidatus Omnitrophica bacterium]|nr:hypothetical protein [Candidatus Omnitrophota bacterium]
MKIPEGNVSPLFYLTQKLFLDMINFRLPFTWDGSWFVHDVSSQIVLRCLPNFFMSLSITLVFYFFARFYSLGAGFYGALVAGSSYMILAYWAIARPYALWNFLTTVQILLFLCILKDDHSNEKVWRLLGITHFLLALTVTFSAVQIAAVSLILFLFKDRDLRKYIMLTFVPTVLCFVYYFATPKYSFYFIDNAMQLISASFPKERLVLVFLLGGFLNWMVVRQGIGSIWEKFKDYKVVFLVFIILMLFFTTLVLGLFYLKAQGQGVGFSLSNRYFIYLTPIGVIAATLFTAEVWCLTAKQLYWRIGLFLFAGGLLIFRLNQSWLLARSFYSL